MAQEPMPATAARTARPVVAVVGIALVQQRLWVSNYRPTRSLVIVLLVVLVARWGSGQTDSGPGESMD